MTSGEFAYDKKAKVQKKEALNDHGDWDNLQGDVRELSAWNVTEIDNAGYQLLDESDMTIETMPFG